MAALGDPNRSGRRVRRDGLGGLELLGFRGMAYRLAMPPLTERQIVSLPFGLALGSLGAWLLINRSRP